MIQTYGPIAQTCLGTLLTWGLTAAGAGLVVIFSGTQRKLLDGSLGFAGGVMIAASYWSLLDPAIQMAEESELYGKNGEYSFVPVAVGFFIGALFVYMTDILLSFLGVHSPQMIIALSSERKTDKEKTSDHSTLYSNFEKSDLSNETTIEGFNDGIYNSNVLSRRKTVVTPASHQHTNSWNSNLVLNNTNNVSYQRDNQWKRILLLIVAVTVHNIPEGLAVGVAFGAIGHSPAATFESARNLAIGIGIQNFPEGLAVSLPLKAAGFSTWRSFWYGQLSGMVEPVAGILGAAAVGVARPVLPYALAFAAGAMIYVVVDDIIPEANTSGNGKLATWGAVFGFIVMMVLDVGLG